MTILTTLSLVLQMHPQALGHVMWGVAVLVVVLLLMVWHFRRSEPAIDLEHAAEPEPETVDNYTAYHGQPADMVVLDPTRSHELAAVVLVYDDAFVIQGERVPRTAVTDVTFNNAAVPVLNQSYQIVFSTTLPDRHTIKVDVGSDAEWASEVTQQVAQHIIIMHNS